MSEPTASETKAKHPPTKATKATAFRPDQLAKALQDRGLTIHPTAELFPLMDRDVYAGLRADIRENGQREPIYITEEKEVVEGRHRLVIADELGIEPVIEVWKGDDPAGFVASMNFHRRDLSPSQRAVLGLQLKRREEDAARSRSRAGLKQNRTVAEVAPLPPRSSDQISPGETRDRAAKAAGVSPRLIQDAARIEREAPEAVEAIKQRKTTVGAVIKKLNADASTPKKKTTNRRSAARSVPAETNDAGVEIAASTLRSVWTHLIEESIPNTDLTVLVVGVVTVVDARNAVLLRFPPPSTDSA